MGGEEAGSRGTGQKHDDLCLDGLALADRADALVGLSLNVDAFDRNAQEAGQIIADGLLGGCEPRSFEDDDGVGVDDAPAGCMDPTEGLGDKDRGIRACPAGVGVGEDLADVRASDRSEEGVGEGVEEDVAIGVACGSAVMFESNAADDEGTTTPDGGKRLQAVEVPAQADAEGEVGRAGSGFRHGVESTDKSRGNPAEPGCDCPRRHGGAPTMKPLDCHSPRRRPSRCP